LNVGVTGRSLLKFSKENKALLERMLIEHPEDLSPLLHELPWWPYSQGMTALERRYQNSLVRVAAGDSAEQQKVYLVADGKKCLITSLQWLSQRRRNATEVELISAEDLGKIRMGPPIRCTGAEQ
jgi:hypothetical protein